MDDETLSRLSVPGHAAELVDRLEDEAAAESEEATGVRSAPDMSRAVPGSDEPPD